MAHRSSFTGIAWLEGQRAGHLHFAGEHADSFYSWQGYMEGCCSRPGRKAAYHRVMVGLEAIAAAVDALRAGGVIGLPTETVYGLAADAANPAAVTRIFAIKGRPSSHPVIVHIGAEAEVARWARDVPLAARDLIRQFWPGPLTLVLPRAESVLPEVTGGQDTVALRMPAHPVALAVLRAFGGGLAAPSANRYGRISPTTAAHVREDLGDDVAIVLDGGASEVGLESTIVACLEGRVRVLRPGVIGADAIAAVVGPLDDAAGPSSLAPRVPGNVPSHYAPLTPVELAEASAVADIVRSHVEAGHRVAALSPEPAPTTPGVTWLSTKPDALEYAHDLYAHLRALDRAGADIIVIARPPVGAAWVAVHDRLTRAATRRP